VVQVAMPGSGPTIADAVDALVAAGAAPTIAPTPITTLPSEVGVRLVAGATEVGAERWIIGVGVGDSSLGPVGLTLYEHEHGAVIGPARSGRSTTLVTLAASLKEAHPGARVLAIARRRSPLRDTPVVDRLATTDEDVQALVDAAMVASGPTLLLVDDAEGVDDP